MAIAMLSIFSSVSCAQSEKKEVPVGTPNVERGRSLFGFRNREEYVMKNVWCIAVPTGKESKDGKYHYTRIEVGSPTRPYAGTPAFRLRLVDGTIVSTAQGDTVDVFQRKAKSDTDAGGTSVYDRDCGAGRKWPEGTRRLQDGGAWTFYVQNGRLLGLEVFYSEGMSNYVQQNGTAVWKGSVPAVGRPDNQIMFEIPLKREDVIRIFGEPEKIKQYLEE